VSVGGPLRLKDKGVASNKTDQTVGNNEV